MSNHRLVPVLALCAAAFVGTLTAAWGAAAKTIELNNDSIVTNSEGMAICGFNTGEGLGVRFTPPAFPARLLKVRVLLTNVGLGAAQTECQKVPIADSIPIGLEVSHLTGTVPGTSLLSVADLGVSNDTTFNEFDLSADKLSIEDGSFFVAFSLQSDNAAPMIDQGAPPGDGNYLYGDVGQGLKWYTFGALGAGAPKGNWAVRVVLEVPDDDGGAGGATQQDGGADGSADGSAGAPEAGAVQDAGLEAGPLPPPEAAEGGGCQLSSQRGVSLAAFAMAAIALLGTRRRRARN